MSAILNYSASGAMAGKLTLNVCCSGVCNNTLFGEIISTYNSYDWQNGVVPDFKFSGKEFDEENSMYYFHNRYYAPPTFISRDELFEKKPFMSPYAYCRNNPVNMIDPDGRDEYEVDVIKQTITVVDGTQGTPDKFTVIRADGTKESSNEYAHGTITKLDSPLGIESYGVTGDQNGKEMFEFLAKETGVEWNHIQTGKGGENGANYLFTSFSPEMAEYDYNVLKGEEIRVFNHNHPNGTTTPSPEDKKALLSWQSYNYRREGLFPYKGTTARMPASYIYTIDGGYTPFDPPTKALYDKFNPINIKR